MRSQYLERNQPLIADPRALAALSAALRHAQSRSGIRSSSAGRPELLLRHCRFAGANESDPLARFARVASVDSVESSRRGSQVRAINLRRSLAPWLAHKADSRRRACLGWCPRRSATRAAPTPSLGRSRSRLPLQAGAEIANGPLRRNRPKARLRVRCLAMTSARRARETAYCLDCPLRLALH